MSADEQAIRDLIATWIRASAEDDLDTVLSLMAEDVVFLIAGRPPMLGLEAFAAASRGMAGRFQIHGKSEVQEVEVAGDWAYCWTRLSVTMTPADGGASSSRSGNTLSVLRRQEDGRWVMYRDANMLAPDPAPVTS